MCPLSEVFIPYIDNGKKSSICILTSKVTKRLQYACLLIYLGHCESVAPQTPAGARCPIHVRRRWCRSLVSTLPHQDCQRPVDHTHPTSEREGERESYLFTIFEKTCGMMVDECLFRMHYSNGSLNCCVFRCVIVPCATLWGSRDSNKANSEIARMSQKMHKMFSNSYGKVLFGIVLMACYSWRVHT